MARANISAGSAGTFGLGAGQGSRTQGLAYKWVVLMVVIVGLFMAVLDLTVVNVALPHIIAVFNAGISQIQLVVTGYALAQAVMIPVAGYLMDTFGGKRIWILSLAAFTIGSVLCAFSWNVAALLLFRVLQGLGGGMLIPIGMAMIYRVVPPEERGTTMGFLGIPILFGPAIGPLLGGYLVQFADWRMIFLVNVPIGVIGVAMAAALLQETPTREGLTFDMAGFVTAAIAFGASLVALSNGPSDGWTAPHIMVLLIVSGVAFVSWVIIELRVPEPLLDLRLFGDLQFSMGTVVMFVAMVAMFGTLYLLPLFLQQLRGLGAYDTGLLMLPQGVAMAVGLPISGKLFDRMGVRPLLFSGLPVLAMVMYVFTRLDVITPDHTLVLLIVGSGLCAAWVQMPLQTAILNRIPSEKINRGTALNNALKQLFGSFGVAMVTTILVNRLTFHQAILAERVTAASPMVHRMMGAAQGMALQHGWTAVQGKQLLLSVLSGQVRQLAAVLSFDDAFLVLTVMALVALVPAAFLGWGAHAQREPAMPA